VGYGKGKERAMIEEEKWWLKWVLYWTTVLDKKDIDEYFERRDKEGYVKNERESTTRGRIHKNSK